MRACHEFERSSSGVRQEMLHISRHAGMSIPLRRLLRPCHHFLAVLLQIAQGAGKAVKCGPAALD